MIGLAFDALTSFSIMPLRIASYLGLILGALSILALGYTLGSWALGRVVEGWTSLLTVVLILGSTQLILFGLLGEYVGRMYLETKRRPLFVIDQILTQQVPAAGQHDAARERASIPGDVGLGLHKQKARDFSRAFAFVMASPTTSWDLTTS